MPSRKQQPPVFSGIEEITVRERTLDFKLSCSHTVSLTALRTMWEDSSKRKETSKSQTDAKE